MIAVAVLLGCLLKQPSIANGQELERFQFRQPHLGTVVEITLYAPSETAANDSARAAFQRIEELNRILSDYDPDSEVMKLCRTGGTGQAVAVSQELFDVLEKSNEISRLSDGAFDVSIGPVIKLWRASRRQKALPDAPRLAAARQLVGWKQIRLNKDARTVELQQAGMSIDFGGIAKGYIADQARTVLYKNQIRQCLVAIGGDIALGDPPPGRDAWRIGVAPLDKPDGEPSRFLALKNCCVSTSGDAFQFVEIAGIRYSHIVDPKSGVGLTHRIGVTVVAADGLTADGLDTAASVLGREQGLKLMGHFPGVAALIVTATDQGPLTTETPEFTRLVLPPATNSP